MNRLARAIGLVVLLLVPASVCAQTARPQGARPDAGQAAGTLPAMIPIFPLEDVMLFPNTVRPLLIFEARYRAMVADALKGDRVIGMMLLRPGYEADYEGRPPVYAIGCAGRIVESQQLPDGRYTIVLQGFVKFRVTSEDQSRAYRLARVEAIPETLYDEDRAVLHSLRPRLMSLVAAVIPPGTALPPPSLPDEDLVNAAAQYLDFDASDRQGLLERNNALSRAQGLIDLLSRK